jgi:hypothetical protein
MKEGVRALNLDSKHLLRTPFLFHYAAFKGNVILFTLENSTMQPIS